MATDDDILTSPVPDPDAEPTAAERAHAKTFADLVDKTLSGRTPPAMSADDRALLEVATVIRAAQGRIELPAPRQRAIVEDVLLAAIDRGARGGGHRSSGGATPIHRARRRFVPWVITGASVAVAAAAVAVLWLRAPARPAAPAQPEVTYVTPTRWTSRPADAVVGPIDRDRAGDAAARIDDIFADRLDGYRERRFEGSHRAARVNRGGSR